MLDFEKYLENIKLILNRTPFLVSTQYDTEFRGDFICIIKGKVVFENKEEFYFREYLVYKEERINKIAYSYHYQDASGNLVIRYDNAEHHKELDSFPHHKHIKDQVISSHPIDLDSVLNEIIDSFT